MEDSNNSERRIDTYDNFIKGDENIRDGQTIITKKIHEWMESDTNKAMFLVSTNEDDRDLVISKLIEEYQLKEKLFIAYNEIHKNYLQTKFGELGDIESIDLPWNLHKRNSDGEQRDYDIIILDEIDILLNHFKSDKITKQRYYFDRFCVVCFNARKILVTNKNYNIRASQFISEFDKQQYIIRNKNRINKKVVVLTQNLRDFNKEIKKDLKSGLNIVLVIPSILEAYSYYEIYRTYNKNCEIYCDGMEFNPKIGTRILIYTRYMEDGVSLNINGFHKVYCLLTDKTTVMTTPYELLRMFYNIRRIIDARIKIYKNDLDNGGCSQMVTFENVENYMKDTIIGRLKVTSKFNLCKEDDELIFKMESLPHFLKPYINNLIYEEIYTQKAANQFMDYFIKLMSIDGHIFCHDYEEAAYY